MQGSEAQKQRPHEFLWMLWFDGKVYLDWAPAIKCDLIRLEKVFCLMKTADMPS